MAQVPSCQAELLDSPMAASLIRSVNVGQNESDTKEFPSSTISISSSFQRTLCIELQVGLEPTTYALQVRCSTN